MLQFNLHTIHFTLWSHNLGFICRFIASMDSCLLEKLDRRRREGSLRSLIPAPSNVSLGGILSQNAQTKHLIDFASNDYLDLARCCHQHNLVQTAYAKHMDSRSNRQAPLLGTTNSRLLSGDSNLARYLEHHLALAIIGQQLFYSTRGMMQIFLCYRVNLTEKIEPMPL